MDKYLLYQDKRYIILRKILEHNIPDKKTALLWKEHIRADIVLKHQGVYIFADLCIEPEIIEENERKVGS